MPRNDGFMMFYNPTLQPVAESVIQSVDVAPTIASYLMGVDIPSQSLGEAHVGFAGPEAQEGLVWQNLIQMRSNAVANGIEVGAMPGPGQVAQMKAQVRMIKQALNRVSHLSFDKNW